MIELNYQNLTVSWFEFCRIATPMLRIYLLLFNRIALYRWDEFTYAPSPPTKSGIHHWYYHNSITKVMECGLLQWSEFFGDRKIIWLQRMPENSFYQKKFQANLMKKFFLTVSTFLQYQHVYYHIFRNLTMKVESV